jgi:tetratricopeptide (TPR) repeat protein
MKNSILLTALILFCIGYLTAQTVSKEEALQFGHRLETATNNGDPYMLDHIFDMDKMGEVITQKSKVMSGNAEFAAGMRRGFTQGVQGYGNLILTTIYNGSYRLLRGYEKDGKQHLLFRMIGKGGLNYHDYILTKSKDSIKATDCFVYTTDEMLSTTISKIADLLDSSPIMPDDAESLVQLTRLYEKGDYAGAKAYYDKLTPKTRQDKATQVLYLAICSKLDRSEYQETLERYVRLYPNESNGYLMMLDLYRLKKEGNKGLMAVNRLDSLIGTDPFLNFYRGVFYEQAGEKALSLACYEKAYQSDPDIVINTKALLMAYGEANENDKAKIVIAEYRKSRSFKQQILDNIYKKYPALK